MKTKRHGAVLGLIVLTLVAYGKEKEEYEKGAEPREEAPAPA